MPSFSYTTHIAAKCELAFSVFSDFSHASEHVQGIESLEILTEGEIGEGTRFRETRVLFGRSSTQELVITSFEPASRYVVEGDSCGAHFRTEFDFLPDIWGTTVTMFFSCRATSLMAKLMSPISLVMMGPMRRMMVADVENLKSVAEALEKGQLATADVPG